MNGYSIWYQPQDKKLFEQPLSESIEWKGTVVAAKYKKWGASKAAS